MYHALAIGGGPFTIDIVLMMDINFMLSLQYKAEPNLF